MSRRFLKGFALTVLLLSIAFARVHNAHAQIEETPYATPTPAPVNMVLPAVAEPEGLTNVALTEGVVVTASGRNGPGTGPWCVKDDSLLTSWKCTPGHEAWLEIDLKRLCRVSQMIVVHPSILSASTGADLGAFNLQVSLRTTEGDAWGPAYPVQNTANAPYLTLEFNPPADCRYARMTVTTPAIDGGPTARVVEWQVWGESLETFPPPWTAIDAGFENAIKTRLENLQSSPYEEGYVQLIQELDSSGKVGLNPPTYADFVKAKAYLDLGFIYEETKDVTAAYGAWQQVKESPIHCLAAQGAVRTGHALITHNKNLPEALEQLTWAIGVYPTDVWARVELIDCYRFSGDKERSRLMAGEVFDGYPDHASLGQVAWAQYKMAQFDGVDSQGEPAPRDELYEAIWSAYKNGGHIPDVADPVAQDVAYRCKWNIVRSNTRKGDLEGAVANGEELLEVFPNRAGGWNACVRASLARSYVHLKDFGKAWEHYNALLTNCPGCDLAVDLPSLQRYISSQEKRYNRLTER